MNDLETMLRTSLHERADDVEPTPELWRTVQSKVARRRAMPLLVWTAAGVAAAVAVVAVVPGLLDRVEDGLVIDPAQSPTAPATSGEDAPGPLAGTPLTHYVAVVDGRLVLRSVLGEEQLLWDGESEVRTLAVRPGSTPEDATIAFVTSAEGMLDLRILGPQVDRTFALGADPGDTAVIPTPAWSPDGGTVALVLAGPGGADLVLASADDVVASETRASLGDVPDPAQLRLQDWATEAEGEVLWFTALGALYRSSIETVDSGWGVGSLARADDGGYVVDVATASDGTQYRLLAGIDGGSGDAEDAGLALEFDNERIAFPDLATGSPADVWMTATDGGAIVGLGSDARLVLRDREGGSEVRSVPGVSYAGWVPVAGEAGTGTPGAAPTGDGGPTTPAEGTPRADGPSSASGVTPYAVVDEFGRVAVIAGDGRDREVIIDEQLWAPEAAVSVMDVTVRPGSSAGEVSGMLLLATEGGPELAWFRAAAGATAMARMEGATGLGNGDTAQRDAPTWSPDGRHIAWVEPSDDGGWTLRTVGMADNGPTDADAAFGIEAPGSLSLRVAAWVWDEAAGATARGRLLLVDDEHSPDAGYALGIERQGDGALAVTGPADALPGSDAGQVADLGERDGSLVLLVRSADGWVLSQDVAETTLPLPFEISAGELDLDVLDDIAVVTNRATGEVYVVDRAGEVTALEVVAHGFDPVR